MLSDSIPTVHFEYCLTFSILQDGVEPRSIDVLALDNRFFFSVIEFYVKWWNKDVAVDFVPKKFP